MHCAGRFGLFEDALLTFHEARGIPYIIIVAARLTWAIKHKPLLDNILQWSRVTPFSPS